MQLPKPTSERVREFSGLFDANERYALADRLLARVFRKWPRNTDLEDVLAKVVLLNGLYSTRVFAVVPMAKHIQSLAIDDDLLVGVPALVRRVATLTIRNRSRVHYSFATKYCSWHHPEQFPIYDAQVARSLGRYQHVHTFADPFAMAALRDYPTFKTVVLAFRHHFGLTECSLREIDKFLWVVGRKSRGS
jgi:hypothetical protein